MPEKHVIVIGGGLAGLVASLHLAGEGIGCTVIEKATYPVHRVCGEYVSREVIPYLTRLGAYPSALQPAQIDRFQLTSTRGDLAELPLDLGGFGLSRYAFDHFLYQLALARGVRFQLNTEVTAVRYQDNSFTVETTQETFSANVVIAAHGKRSRLDKEFKRAFISRHSPYVGVKYHIRLPGFPADLIALHNFENGYCGISAVEGGIFNLCYLTHRDNVRTHGNLKEMEESVLLKNPFLKDIFTHAEFLFERPETINEISFETKGPREGHVLMCGDAAGMITPLCGNGMALAIHSAKLAAERVVRFCQEPGYNRERMEQDYESAWKQSFAFRLWAGRNIQRLFGAESTSQFAVQLARRMKPLANGLIRLTHGKPF
ncbi:MAG: NAD(P)/FAD-dependent oxidoreductase [Cyclobacteriaceae bacterium]|nr:NAD(P)/FAD-dependent oxidoreductase [Cyclobacteriaceae bacterium]